MSPGSPGGSPYRVLHLIGEGGMGEVYAAEDTRLQRRVAIKRIRADLGSDATLRQRLITEARAAARLDHPNICGIHEVGEDEGGPFIVMPFIEGETLAGRLARGPLPIEAVLDVGTQLADAVSAAHAQGILHRDLKPANVILDPRGQARVMDFGLAKITNAPDAEAADTQLDLTMTGVPIGTTAYMSPEQARGEHVDARSDIFSLGVILYELLTGHRPFVGASTGELVSSILTVTPLPVTRARPEAPDDLQRIISKALRKDRDERYQTAGDLLADLRTLKRQASSGAPSKATIAVPAAPRGRALRLATGTVAVGALLAVAVGYWWFGRETVPTAQITSVAVLPPANLSGNSEQDFFAIGMTDALITELSRLKELRVTSRDSSMQLKRQGKRMPDLGRELQVAGLVDCSIVRVGNQVRISADLIHAASDSIVWTKAYEGDLSDVLALQRRVAGDIARWIRVTVSPDQRRTLAAGRVVNPQAQELYLRARGLFQTVLNTQPFRPERLAEAIRAYEEAIALEPRWGNPYAGLAAAKHWMATLDPKRFFPESREAALTAIALDDEIAAAHGSLAYVSSAYFWDWETAEREYRKCLDLSSSSECFHGYAMMLNALGRFDEAAAAYTSARERDPLAPVLRISAAWSWFYAGRYDVAEREAQQLINAGLEGRYLRGWALAWQGRFDESLEIFRTLATEKADSTETQLSLISVLAKAGRGSEARTLVRPFEKRILSPSDERALAKAYAHLGDPHAAVAALERAYSSPPAWLAIINVDPSFKPLHGHSRFQDLLRRMRLRD